MKKLMKMLLIILGVIVVLMVMIILFLLWASKQPSVKECYFNDVITDAPCEFKYTQMGAYEVSSFEQASDNKQVGKFRVWYPTEMETSGRKYPLVVMVNGSGTPAWRKPQKAWFSAQNNDRVRQTPANKLHYCRK